jgi:hypothetical protein
MLACSSVPVAHAQDEEVFEAEGAEEEYRNALNFGFIYVHSILREVETLPEEEGARGGENLYGLAYIYVVNAGSISKHDLNASLNGVYYFQRGQRARRPYGSLGHPTPR